MRLDIDAGHVTLTGPDLSIRQQHPGPDERIRDLAWRVGHRIRPEVVHELGVALGERFLGGPVGAALAEVIARESRTRLAVACADPGLADLPWETVVVPGRVRPLALDTVDVWRVVAAQGVVERSPGPLRIVAAIGAPDVGGGELLDYEGELSHILDAVDPSRERHALVRVLEWGSLSAIHTALAAEPCDVLHVSCHGQPGELVLETDTGAADRVDATRFLGALPTVPTLVVLAGCATAVGGRSDLAGLARGLVAGGIPAVLAMSGTVSDDYATALCARLYDTLARPGGADLATALSEARRDLAQDGLAPQWVNPVLVLADGTVPVLSCGPAEEDARSPRSAVLGGAVRRVGDFVGRRAALRALTGATGGVLLHGIGGVGKTSLAAELAARSADPVVVLSGEIHVDTALDAVRAELSGRCADLAADHPLRAAVTRLADPRAPWDERLALIDGVAPPIVLVLDNAEDNLDAEHKIADGDLAEFLDRWSGHGRLLITSRHPFPVEGVTAHHVGPLSWPETRKLMWRLPALDALPPGDRWQAWNQLGGHPRALEYLDAVLRGGEARFADVTARLATARAGRRVVDGGLDAAVAEVGSLIADDVLLPELLGRLRAVPIARPLLVGASVYRRPVVRAGLDWQVADVAEHAADADLDHPPLTVPAGVDDAVDLLSRLGLLVPTDDGYLVHRWTAGALHRMTPPDLLAKAHDRASEFRWWFVRAKARRELADVEEMIESGHHSLASGDVSNAIEVTRVVAGELLTRGNWAWAEQLCAQALGWFGATERQSAGLLLQLAKIRHARGDIDHARHLLTESLPVFVECGDRGNAAATRHQLALIAEHASDLFTAKRLYLETLATYEELGDRRAMGVAHHQLAGIAKSESDTAAAEEHYERALVLAEEVDDLEGVAAATHQLGIIAQNRHDLDRAATCFRFARDRFAVLGDRILVAVADIALGEVARVRRDLAGAETHTRAALREFESVGDRAHIAEGLLQLGYIARDRGDHQWAESCASAAAVHFEQVGSLAQASRSYRLAGALCTMLGRYRDGVQAILQADTTRQRAGMAPGDETEWLAIQCRELGDEAFLATARECVSPDEAAGALEAARWINGRMDQFENQGGSAGDFHRFGRKAAERRDFGEALPFLREALARYAAIGHLAGVGHTNELLGNALGEMGDPASAADHFRAALDINQRRSIPENIAVNYHQLGQMCQRQGEHDEAAAYFRASIEIKRRTGNRPGVVNSLFHLGRVAEDSGDFAEALRCYEECLDLDAALGDRGGMAVTQAQIGIVLRRRERPREAVPWLVAALRTNLDLGSGNAARNLIELRRNRADLGEVLFLEALTAAVPADWVTRVVSLTDMVPRAPG